MSKRKRSQLFVINNPNAPRLCPELALEIGLNESIILLQIEFWISLKPKEKDGHLWTYQSLRKIKDCFPFWGLETINRAIRSLKVKKLLLVRNYNRTAYDRTRWFALDPRGFQKLRSVQLIESDADRHFSNWEMEDSKMGNRSDQNETPIPETSTENTTERSRGAARAVSSSSLKSKNDPAVEEIARALSDVTGQDLDLNFAKLTKAARLLAPKATDVAALVRKHYGRGGWWYREDWRGKSGSAPNISNINETWGKWGSAPVEQSSKPKKVRR